MEVVDSKYAHVNRTTVTSTISTMVIKEQDIIHNLITGVSSVSVTVDMRSFLGVTMHLVGFKDIALCLCLQLLSCNRFEGKHTGEKISEAFDRL